VKISNFEKIYSDSFGLWVSGLFSAIEGNNRGLSFDNQREAFFEIIKLWLDQGGIKFCKPTDPLSEVWHVRSDQIVEYLKSHWPQHATNEDDDDLNMYFYEIPAIFWVGSDGKLHGRKCILDAFFSRLGLAGACFGRAYAVILKDRVSPAMEL
jgi:hypothetical protein